MANVMANPPPGEWPRLAAGGPSNVKIVEYH
jgi:hypothetical protein